MLVAEKSSVDTTISPTDSLSAGFAQPWNDRSLGSVTSTRPCQRNDPELWFADQPAAVEQAKLLCGECPVRAQCLAGALERREFAGVWGGQLFVQGEIVAMKRGRGRPRKNVA